MQTTSASTVIAITCAEQADHENSDETKIAVKIEGQELTNAQYVTTTEFGWSWCEVLPGNAVWTHERSLVDAERLQTSRLLQLPTTLTAIHSVRHLRSHVVLVCNDNTVVVFSAATSTAHESTAPGAPLVAVHALGPAIADVSSSNSLFLCCTTDKRVFAIRDEQPDVLEHVPFPPGARVRSVRCAEHHCVALSDRGEVFTWGDCSYGRLGLAEDDSSSKQPQPQEVQALGGTGEMQPDGTFNGIKLVDCGLWHSVAVSHVDDVFVWGWNNDGQLGSQLWRRQQYQQQHADDEDNDGDGPQVGKVVGTPQRLSALDPLLSDGEQIVQVTCGATFTALQTSCSKLLVFGRLGLPSSRADRSILRGVDIWPQIADCFPGKRLSDLMVTAGRWHLCVADL